MRTKFDKIKASRWRQTIAAFQLKQICKHREMIVFIEDKNGKEQNKLSSFLQRRRI